MGQAIRRNDKLLKLTTYNLKLTTYNLSLTTYNLSPTMFNNYFILAWRTLWKNKVFSAINVLGLAIGISASLVIFLLVSYHFSFDKFEKDNERIYRVVSEFDFSGEAYYNQGVTSPLGSALKKELTGFDAVIPFRTWDGDAKVTIPAASGKEPLVLKHENKLVFADGNYFALLGYQWLAGSPATAVHQPYQAVLTQIGCCQIFSFNAPRRGDR